MNTGTRLNRPTASQTAGSGAIMTGGLDGAKVPISAH